MKKKYMYTSEIVGDYVVPLISDYFVLSSVETKNDQECSEKPHRVRVINVFFDTVLLN